MKITKTIMIDNDVAIFMKDKNLSGTINNLLREYMGKVNNPYIGWNEKELEKELKKLDIQEEAQKKIKELENDIK